MKAIDRASSTGNADLPLEGAALKAANVIDCLLRAVDSQGQKLPRRDLVHAFEVASGAGFTTTSTLLSRLIFGLMTYPGMQARLLQELVDNDFTSDTEVFPRSIEKLTFQTRYVKEMPRLRHPSYQPGRVAKLDYILPGGYKVHEGDVVVSAIHHIHTNVEWWENAGSMSMSFLARLYFTPDRRQCIPFVTGQRMCTGFNISLQEVKVFLSKLVCRYHWEKEGESAVEYEPFFQLIRPVNLYARTTWRT